MDTTEVQTEQKKPGRFRLIKRILAGLVIGMVALLAIASVTVWLLQDKIKAKIVAEVNNRLTVPVQVKGPIELSLFKHFPYVSLSFTDVIVDDKVRGKDKKLLNVHEVSLLCNFFSLFGDKVEFSKIVVNNGELNMYRDEAGRANFDIFKPADNKESGPSIQLKKAQIKGLTFSYIDKTQGINTSLAVNNIFLKGDFSQSLFELAATGKIHVNQLQGGGQDLLQGKNVKIDVALQVDKVLKKYSFKGGKIVIDESEFNVEGFFAAKTNGTQLDFKLTSNGKDVRQLLSLLPAKWQEALSNTEGSGQYAVTATIKGMASKLLVPSIDVEVELADSEVKLGRFKKLLKKVNAKAKYESDEYGHNRLVISNFACTLNELPFNFKLTLDNLQNPSFNFYANGVLQLSELASVIPDSIAQDMDGAITFNNFHLQGKKADFTDVDNSTLSGSGEFKISNGEFRQNGITYGNINGTLKYNDRVIDANNISLNFLSTDLSFSGTVENLFAFIYNLSAKRRANDVVLGVNGKVKCNTFNLSGILDAYDKKNRPRAQVKQKINIREILSMKGNLEVEIGKFVFRKMEFNQLASHLQIAPGIIRINTLQANTMDGEIRTQGDISFTADSSLNINCDVSLLNLSIPKVFNQCENFGQTTLTDRHLKGTITAAVNLNATWLNYKQLDPGTLSAVIDFNIKNGELVNFEPLRAASKFIRIDELQDIRFADLQNTIKIADSRIDVPEFEIKTSALNLILYGHHYFDNTIDYHFKINLHKLLAQKFKRKTNDDEYVESDPYEGVNLYLSMTGNLADPKIKYDKASTRNKVKDDFKKEREEMKNLLRNNPVKKDENEQKREDKYFNTSQPPVFMDFEEDSGKKDN